MKKYKIKILKKWLLPMQHPVTMNASPLYSVISLIPVVYFSDSQITKLQTTYG